MLDLNLKVEENGCWSFLNWQRKFILETRIFQFWQYNNQPKEIYSEKFIWSKIDNIHSNPVRSGIVSRPEDYLYWSSSNYFDNKDWF